MAAVVIALLLLAAPAFAAQPEEKCTEINDSATGTCNCAESFDDNSDADYDYPGSGSHSYNPSLSTTFECPNQTYLKDVDKGYPTTGEAEMPAGSTASYVLRVFDSGNPGFGNQAKASNGAYLNTAGEWPAGTERACVRHYVRLSADYPQIQPIVQTDDTCNRKKSMKFVDEAGGSNHGPGNQLIQLTFLRTEFGGSEEREGDVFNPSIACRDSWCRAEGCCWNVTGSTMTCRGRWTVLDTGDQQESWPTSNFSGQVAGGSADIGFWFTSQSDQGFGTVCDPGESLYSYAMGASWDVEDGQWIGAACEVEGGCGPPGPTGVIAKNN